VPGCGRRTCQLAGERLPADLHTLVRQALELRHDAALRERIYEERVLAETRISRPVMKRFKARIRREGLFCAVDETPEEEVA